MRSQLEKNKEILLEEIEKLSFSQIDNAIASRLNAYRGAYKALCMIDAEGYTDEVKTTRTEEKAERTVELDGDTEFEKIIISIPFDITHAKAVASIIADHMESLCVMNRRAYDNIMARLREVAKS